MAKRGDYIAVQRRHSYTALHGAGHTVTATIAVERVARANRAGLATHVVPAHDWERERGRRGEPVSARWTSIIGVMQIPADMQPAAAAVAGIDYPDADQLRAAIREKA